MSSPPPSASSPTDRSFSLPQKRPSFSLPGGGSQKRRKASFASASSHPLRQTSFPPPGATSPQRAPSRQSSFSPSVSSFGGRGGGGGGKKRKQHARANSAAADSASKAGAGASGSAKEGDGKGDREEDDVEDEDELDADDTMLESGLAGGGTKEENENLALLMDAFNPDQEERYAAYRRVKLKKEVVRRIVNQTLSQSVPQSIVTTINGYTKVFIGDMVERARDVQTEWLAAKQQTKAAQETAPGAATTSNAEKSSAPTVGPGAQVPRANGTTAEPVDPRKSLLEVKEYDRGPLTPDHLREALRRYKKDSEGGNAGFQGLSLHGVEGTASRSGGRRLFR